MKKILLVLFCISITQAWAEHYFNVCYYNWTKSSVSYNNNGVHHKWKQPDPLVGSNSSGEIPAGDFKCFKGFADETIFTKHYITFYVNNKWFGIVNPGFSRPYAISQDAQNTKGGRLFEHVVGGKDNYDLFVHVKDDGSIILSGSKDLNDETMYIVPQHFS